MRLEIFQSAKISRIIIDSTKKNNCIQLFASEKRTSVLFNLLCT